MNISRMAEASSVPLLQQVIDFTAARHELLAGNVANATTENYRTRDLSVDTFQDRLKSAIEARRNEGTTVEPGLKESDFDRELRQVKDSMRHVLFHDKTDIDMEKQVAEISKNQYMHNMAITIMTNQFRLLQAAVSERV